MFINIKILNHKHFSIEFNKIKYVVVQSGVGLDLGKMENTGNYNADHLHAMVKIAHRYNKLTKEHNGDYLSFHQINSRFSEGLDAINIAPELGQIETCALIDLLLDYDEIMERLFQLCLESNRWEKWVTKDYNPNDNKIELIKICGHYIFSEYRFETIINEYSNLSGLSKEDLSAKIKKIITKHLNSLLGNNK